jgi:anaerobic ribonucleoside-triphosphate reductase
MTQEEWNIKRTLTIIYSRVVGWFTPVKNFNPGKANEFKDRKVFKI